MEHLLEDEPTVELNRQLKEINEQLKLPDTLFKSTLWAKKLRILIELSYRKKT